MGKEWYWTGKSSKRVEGVEASENPSGCICAVFNFFDFHPFHFPTLNQQQEETSFKSQEDHTSVPKGAEAPRNSLESEDGTIISPLSKEESFKMPKNIQTKTSGRSTRNLKNELLSSSSETSNISSPGTKTPTLVARLMGLDLLPHSPSSSCLSTPNLHSNIQNSNHLRHQKHIQTKPRNSTDSDIITTRSLPETPRISSSRRSDVDHHRLSLQIIKENMNMDIGEDLELPRLSFSKRKCDENIHSKSSPSHYGKQIVKQVKESVVSRKVGQDITNNLKSREEFEGKFRSKKKIPKTSFDESSPGKHSNPSISPRIKNKPNTTPKEQKTQIPKILTKPKPSTLQEIQNKKKAEPKCKKVSNETFKSRIKRPPQNKQEEAFIILPTSSVTRVSDTKSTKNKKNHPLSNNILNNFNNVSNFLPVKIDPSPPATKIPQKQVSESQEWKSSRRTEKSSSWRQRYEQERTTASRNREIDEKLNASNTTGAEPEFQYISNILNRTNYTTTTPLLDPSIFHHLEHHTTVKDRNFSPNNQLGHRSNRILLFDLVGEILKDIFESKGNDKRLWFLQGKCYQGSVQGSGRAPNSPSLEGLIERVWKRVGEFPCAKCEVLEDIDALIEAEDMEELEGEDANGKEEEGEAIVAEIEGNIWDTLVLEETVMLIMDSCGEAKVGSTWTISQGRRRFVEWGWCHVTPSVAGGVHVAGV